MTRSAYWWSPTRELRPAVGEAARHGRAWGHLIRHGGGRVSNFGDEVAPWLVEELTGSRPRWGAVGSADLICVGSILDVYARAGGTGQVLGSGIREPQTAVIANVDLDRVVLLRGQSTQQALGADPGLPLGDPGLVIANMVSRPARGQSGVVVVPHFASLGDRRSRHFLAACRAEGWRVVLPNQPPLEVARSISAADLVLTSSLHGLVFADAYGVAGQLVGLTEGPGGEPGFKYGDYGSALEVESHPVPLTEVLRSPDPTAWIDALATRSATVAAELPRVVDAIYRAAGQIA